LYWYGKQSYKDHYCGVTEHINSKKNSRKFFLNKGIIPVFMDLMSGGEEGYKGDGREAGPYLFLHCLLE
jgi:hypothetical protein